MFRFDESCLPHSNLVVANSCPRGQVRLRVFQAGSSNFLTRGSDKVMGKQKALASFLQENQISDFAKDDLFVNITLYRVPANLVREFALRIAVHYPGGIGEAIQDLMKNAIK